MGSCTNYCRSCTDDTKEIKTGEVKGSSTTPYKKNIYDDNNPAVMGGGGDVGNQYNPQYQQNPGIPSNSFNRSMNQLMNQNYSIEPHQQDFAMEHE